MAFLYPDAYNGWLEEGYKTAFASYEEMLTFLDSATDASFPDVGELSYVIDPIPADVANSGVAAYFINPAVDESGPLRIRVNTQNTVDMNALSTFSTLAHEGTPGTHVCFGIQLSEPQFRFPQGTGLPDRLQ